MYSVDSFSVHDFLIQYVKQAIMVGQHTLARASFRDGTLKWGTDNTKPLFQTAVGLNCFGVSLRNLTFELYGTSRAIVNGCSNGTEMNTLYVGDASATGGDAITGTGLIENSYINPATNGRALVGSFTLLDNGIYWKSQLNGGAAIGNTFYTNQVVPPPGNGLCFVTMNQGTSLVSEKNTFSQWMDYSYCAANSLSPQPIVKRGLDIDKTNKGIRPGIVIQ